MALKKHRRGPFPSATEDARASQCPPDSIQCQSPSYRLAFQDPDFMLREELRPVRLQLELLKPELMLQEAGIESTIVIYGSARIPDPQTAQSHLERVEQACAQNPQDAELRHQLQVAQNAVVTSQYYDESRKLGRIISQSTPDNKLVVITGGGAGIMGAANHGAHDVQAKNIGLNIVLPHEQAPNQYITPDLTFQFHYFAIRKMHFLLRAKGLVVFPGGFGTLDELFESLTLLQTRKIQPIPVLLFCERFWRRIINFDALVEEGTISQNDLDFFQFVETAEEAWEILAQHNGVANANGSP